jgi:hypothetical protein
MTKGENYSIYHFKVVDLEKLESYFFLTGKEIYENLGIPRSTIYYSLKTKSGKIGNKYVIEKCYIPKKFIVAGQ